MSLTFSKPRADRSDPGIASRMLAGLARTIEIWLIRRQGRQDLSLLDDRLLDDIGISREDALRKAGKAFWRD